MPIVTIQQSPRPLEAKRRLVAGITDAFVDAYGVRPEHVQVFIDEVGHYPMLERPDECNRKLREVLKEFAARK